MLKSNELEQVKTLIESFQPPLTFFEKQILVPGMHGRLEYIIDIFEEIKKVCADTQIANDIDAPLRNIVDTRVYTLGAKPPKVGEQYLLAITRQCDEEFIKPIREILTKFPIEQVLRSIDETTDFLNTAANSFQVIIGCKDRLFSYSLRTFLHAKNTKTGEVILGPPTELALILMPFQTRLDEMAHVASTAKESIEQWGKQIREQKSKHVDLIDHLSQIKAATEQARAARLSLFFQIAVILFTVSLVWASQRAGLYLEKHDLEDTLSRLQSRTQKCEIDLQSANARLNAGHVSPAKETNAHK